MPEQMERVTKSNARADQLTLPALYDEAVERYGTLVAMKSHYPWGYQSISYQEYGRLISFLGAGLTASGLERGDKVTLIAENSPEWTVVYAAVVSCGGIIVPIDPKLKENEIRHLLLHSNTKFLVTSPALLRDRIEGMRLEGTIVVVIGERESKGGFVTLGEIMALGKEKISAGEGDFFRRKAEVDPGDVASICYTSGTTGQPKGAVLLHRNLVSNVRSIRRRIPFSERDVFLCLLPLHHTFSTTCNFNAPFSAGCSIVFGRSMKTRDIREDIERERVTVLVGVPLLFEHMAAAMRGRLKEIPRHRRLLFRMVSGAASLMSRVLRRNVTRNLFKRQLSESGLGSVRFCISGAAALRAGIEETFSSIGLPIVQGYGLTETSPVVSVNPIERPKKGTVGPPLDDVDVEIKEPNEEGIGEIVVSGPNVMREYFKNPGATADVLKGGKFYTGDLGTMDADGYITIVGRKKSVIVTAGGKNVYPDEIEILLGKSQFILESVVLGIADRKGNVRTGAIIVPDYDALAAAPRPSGTLSEEGIRETIRSEVKSICADLADYKRIADIQIRDQEFPKTTTRKIKRHLVKWIEE